MAKDDDLSKLGLDDDEIELIKQRRKQRREEDEREVWIKDGEKEIRMPWSIGRGWARKWGFDLEDEEAAPEPEPEPEEDDEDKPKRVRFGGRTIA